jgi:hypothetical protein
LARVDGHDAIIRTMLASHQLHADTNCHDRPF